MGNTEVNAGTLEVLASDALPYGTGLIVDANGTVDIGDPSGAGSSVVVTSSFAAPHAGGVAAVPEPGTLALLAVAAVLAVSSLGGGGKGVGLGAEYPVPSTQY